MSEEIYKQIDALEISLDLTNKRLFKLQAKYKNKILNFKRGEKARALLELKYEGLLDLCIDSIAIRCNISKFAVYNISSEVRQSMGIPYYNKDKS